MTAAPGGDAGPGGFVAPGGLVGFVGLGMMGEPMARNLVDSGVPLLVWNRSARAGDALAAAGASVAADVPQVFASAEIVFAMLASETVVDETLRRGTSDFDRMLHGRTLVNCGTVSPAYAAGLATDVDAAGGRYVEATVSGSRVPAEQRRLVGMLAGPPDAVGAARALVDRLCVDTFVCGDAAPAATLMKLAVNSFLISMLTGLAEAFRFAEANGLDLELFRDIIGAGAMSSPASRVKLDMLVAGDVTAQARVTDVWKNARLVVGAARAAGVDSPLLDTCERLYAATEASGRGDHDLIAVATAIAIRSTAR